MSFFCVLMLSFLMGKYPGQGQNFRTFPSPQKETSSLFTLTPHLHPPHQTTTNLLSVSICLPFWTVYINGIIQFCISFHDFPSLLFECQLKCYLFSQTLLLFPMSAPYFLSLQNLLQLLFIYLFLSSFFCLLVPLEHHFPEGQNHFCLLLSDPQDLSSSVSNTKVCPVNIS